MTKIEVTSSSEYYYDLANAEAYIGDNLCGSFPSDIDPQTDYTIYCDLVGDFVKIVAKNIDDYITFAEIKVFGNNAPCNLTPKSVAPADQTISTDLTMDASEFFEGASGTCMPTGC